ncbi:MAG: SOS response-associated peptidase [Methylomonas sp.]|jgi:putative SOS response-associated peptidase YedK|uniref:SOS response-associated peptidase n=1 Tax=Methylomonas sp. TaxID=418 RepID=UPI0025E445CA|nr:SOS response-associated peptidase [Methylomonas sp.]MCK9606596.1 SOS response-associated peptidase [Methylomonas sp.]
MCGRYSLSASSETIVEHFQLLRQLRFQPSYNIAPSQKILSIVELDDQSRKAVKLFWGLVPSWSKDTKNSSHLINARAETVREKPSFRAAFKHRRCLIPADGFYEWAKNADRKQAFHIHRADNQLFAFAGLWEQWQHETDTLYSCTIITAAATELMQPIHDRMPVIIPLERYHQWLDKSANPEQAFALLDNAAYTEMTTTPVSDWVNNPRHDDERCIQMC